MNPYDILAHDNFMMTRFCDICHNYITVNLKMIHSLREYNEQIGETIEIDLDNYARKMEIFVCRKCLNKIQKAKE